MVTWLQKKLSNISGFKRETSLEQLDLLSSINIDEIEVLRFHIDLLLYATNLLFIGVLNKTIQFWNLNDH